jgi:hypothetical protein
MRAVRAVSRPSIGTAAGESFRDMRDKIALNYKNIKVFWKWARGKPFIKKTSPA